MTTITPFEAECMVSKMGLIEIEHIGNSKWMRQHEYIEKLNIQCHQSAQTKHDEYVVNEIITQEKLSTIIYNLITLEIWKQKIFPLIVDKINDDLSVKTYMILYEEATLVTMLQIILYHASSIQESSSVENDDTPLLELVDYCHRKLVSVISNKVNASHFNCHEDEANTSKKLIKQRQHLEFVICSCCISIIRFFTEHLSKTSISVMERVINTHEIIITLITLIENKPWTKKSEKGIEKFDGTNKFIQIDKNHQFRLTKIEGELWLSIYYLLLDKTCANKYELNGFRKNEILKLKKYLLPQIIDQLPILKGLKRTLEELSILNIDEMNYSFNNNINKKLMFVEIVPEFREKLLFKDFQSIAKQQLLTTFNANEYDESDRKMDIEILSRIYNNFDDLEDMLLEQPVCAKCGQNAQNRCSKCKSEWYCCRQCQVKSWKKHKKICQQIAENREKYATNSNEDSKQQTKPMIKEITSKTLKTKQ